jgi:hypothetical protein
VHHTESLAYGTANQPQVGLSWFSQRFEMGGSHTKVFDATSVFPDVKWISHIRTGRSDKSGVTLLVVAVTSRNSAVPVLLRLDGQRAEVVAMAPLQTTSKTALGLAVYWQMANEWLFN